LGAALSGLALIGNVSAAGRSHSFEAHAAFGRNLRIFRRSDRCHFRRRRLVLAMNRQELPLKVTRFPTLLSRYAGGALPADLSRIPRGIFAPSLAVGAGLGGSIAMFFGSRITDGLTPETYNFSGSREQGERTAVLITKKPRDPSSPHLRAPECRARRYHGFITSIRSSCQASMPGGRSSIMREISVSTRFSPRLFSNAMVEKVFLHRGISSAWTVNFHLDHPLSRVVAC
jgi:hypothetical protein